MVQNNVADIKQQPKSVDKDINKDTVQNNPGVDLGPFSRVGADFGREGAKINGPPPAHLRC